MQTQVGLGFAWLLLNENQRAQVKAVWSKYPPGRYLLPFELGRLLRVEIKQTISDDQDNSMKKTWIDFCRTGDFGQDSVPITSPEWLGWLDYAGKHYQEPLPLVASGTDWHDK